MKKARVKVLREDKWQIKKKLVLKEEKVYMLKNKEWRVDIIQLYHGVLVAEYGGRQKMTKSVMRKYQQLGVIKDIKKYVDRCDMY